jgi:predicted permease
MRWLRKLRSLFRKNQLDAEMADEMRLHVELQTELNRKAGMNPEDARYAALRQFGNVASVQERARDIRGWCWLDELRQDVRSAFRQIAKSPGFSVVVVLTLAFGIAVNSVLFGIMNVFFLQPSMLPGAERLVILMHRTDMMQMPLGLSYPDYRDYRGRLKNVEGLIAFMPTPAHLSAEGAAPQRTWVEVVSPNAFVDMGVPAAIGRVLLPADSEAKGAAPVAVLAYDHWKKHFGADPGMLGRVVRLNGKPFTVVGVAAEHFHGFHSMIAASAFVPAGAIDTFRPSMADMLEWRGAPSWRVMGRLKAGATLQTARAEAVVLLEQLAREFPDTHRNYRSFVIAENRARPDPGVAEFLPVFAALFTGLVALVLGSACANVANLMIARAATRQHELTVRAALGAGRGRLIRQLLVESLLLAAIAGIVGWLLADVAGWVMQAVVPQKDPPVATDAAAGWLGYLFTAAISLVAGLASGLLPALRASRVDLVSQLKCGPAEALTGGRHRLRDLLVIGQVTMSLVVLICAGLFLQSLRRVQSVDLGFRPERLLMLSYDLTMQGYDEHRSRNFNDALLTRVRALPGVESAGLTSHVPFDKQINAREARPENPPPELKDGVASVKIAMVSPGYAGTLGVRLRQGRGLSATDQANTPRVALVNVAMANVCWPGQDAVGKRFQPWKDGPWIEVVGVTETAKYMMLSEAPSPSFLVPLTQESAAPVTLLVRTIGEPSALANRLRSEVQVLDAQLPLYDVMTMDELMGSSVFAELPLRMGMGMALVQGGISLLLSIMGLYAVVSFGVAQRAREIGIRMALGADPGRVVSFVVRDGMRLSGVGMGAGLLFSVLLGLGLSKVLFGLGAIEPVTFGVVSGLMLGTTALACWLPARRAAKVDPVIALRAE